MLAFLISEKWPQTCTPCDNSFLLSESQGEVISIQTCRARAQVSVHAGKRLAARAGPGSSEHFSSSLGKLARSVGVIHADRNTVCVAGEGRGPESVLSLSSSEVEMGNAKS